MAASHRHKLNVGGSKYEVSDSLLDRFPNSMLRRLTCDAWNDQENTEDEIFIERNGHRFQYVLDLMRDATVSLPFAVPRAQCIADLEYFNIDYEDSQIKLCVEDPKDLFYDLVAYRDFFDATKKDIDQRFREVCIEKAACELASDYFERLGRPGVVWRSDGNKSYRGKPETDLVTSYFVPTKLSIPSITAPDKISVKDIEPLMKEKYGLSVSRVIMERTRDYGRERIVYSDNEANVGLLSKSEMSTLEGRHTD